ncbi:MAG: hypothetical protein SFZ23_01850 [Planctomycetota bacterium]|nr:hypothetical protein [Planctomycetota bacterium]
MDSSPVAAHTQTPLETPVPAITRRGGPGEPALSLDRLPRVATPPPGSSTLESRLSLAAENTRRSLRDVIGSASRPVRSPSDLIRCFGVNKDLASKLLLALEKPDPLAVAYFLPGAEALTKFLDSAQRRINRPEPMLRAREAVRQFATLVEDELGGRQTLEAAASVWLPEVRARVEAATRQAAYKSQSMIRGVTCDVAVHVAIVHPTRVHSEHCDSLMVLGYVGLRRLRPGAPLFFMTAAHGEGRQVFTLSGDPVGADASSTLLREFTSRPIPELRAASDGENLVYHIDTPHLGASNAVDVYFAEVSRGAMRRYTTEPGRRTGASHGMTIPARELVFDLLVHEELYHGCEPELLIYDTVWRGAANPNDRRRDIDRLDILDSIRVLGRGVASCRAAELPRHVELIENVCASQGWSASSFRAFRCHSHYPVYGSQFSQAIRLPMKPDDPVARGIEGV